MTSNPSKFVTAKASTDRSRARPATPASVDDDFHEFFKQGDVGDYEGGVAYSQPPSKVLPSIEEPQPAVDTSARRARRAFFARVVAVVVTACVVLLVTAARFKPHPGATSESAIQRPAGETTRQLSPATRAVANTPQVLPALPQAAALAPPPPVQPDLDEDPEPEPAAKQDEPARKAPEAEPAKVSDTLPTAKEQTAKIAVASPSLRSGAAKASGRIARKTTAAANREPRPLAPSAPTVVGQSVGAFPVE